VNRHEGQRRKRDLQRRKRNELGWYLVGVVVLQVALAIGIERYWPAIRDPDFAEIERLIRERTAEAPHRPLVVALGSSRTQMSLATERLNDRSDPRSPIVINAAIPGGGPMMDQIVLRRLLDAGHRPELVFVEAMPMALSRRDGAPFEERARYQSRHTLGEVVQLWSYYAERYRLFYPWLTGRLLPAHRYQAEIRQALGVDRPSNQPFVYPQARDSFGWLRCPVSYPPEEVAERTRENLSTYARALSEPALAPGAMRALHDVVTLCQEENIRVVLVVPAEGSAFRNFAPEVEAVQVAAARALAEELQVPIVDARLWVDDAGFYDGHHTTQRGAYAFTDRFALDVLAPHMPQAAHFAARPRPPVGPDAQGTPVGTPVQRHDQ
jgi:hypothetical protein